MANHTTGPNSGVCVLNTGMCVLTPGSSKDQDVFNVPRTIPEEIALAHKAYAGYIQSQSHNVGPKMQEYQLLTLPLVNYTASPQSLVLTTPLVNVPYVAGSSPGPATIAQLGTMHVPTIGTKSGFDSTKSRQLIQHSTHVTNRCVVPENIVHDKSWLRDKRTKGRASELRVEKTDPSESLDVNSVSALGPGQMVTRGDSGSNYTASNPAFMAPKTFVYHPMPPTLVGRQAPIIQTPCPRLTQNNQTLLDSTPTLLIPPGASLTSPLVGVQSYNPPVWVDLHPRAPPADITDGTSGFMEDIATKSNPPACAPLACNTLPIDGVNFINICPTGALQEDPDNTEPDHHFGHNSTSELKDTLDHALNMFGLNSSDTHMPPTYPRRRQSETKRCHAKPKRRKPNILRKAKSTGAITLPDGIINVLPLAEKTSPAVQQTEALDKLTRKQQRKSVHLTEVHVMEQTMETPALKPVDVTAGATTNDSITCTSVEDAAKSAFDGDLSVSDCSNIAEPGTQPTDAQVSPVDLTSNPADKPVTPTPDEHAGQHAKMNKHVNTLRNIVNLCNAQEKNMRDPSKRIGAEILANSNSPKLHSDGTLDHSRVLVAKTLKNNKKILKYVQEVVTRPVMQSCFKPTTGLDGGLIDCTRCDFKGDHGEIGEHMKSKDPQCIFEIPHRLGKPRMKITKLKQPKKCPHCGLVSSNDKDYVMHRLTFHPDQKLECLVCGQTFLLPRELTHHKVEAHSELYPKLLARSEQWNSQKNLEVRGSGSKAGRVLCEECGDSFSDTKSHRSHIFTVHVPSPRCPICKVEVKDRMDAHLRNHKNGVSAKPHLCDMCGACFRQKDYLKRHMTTVHSDVRSFNCGWPECNWKFKSKRNLNVHMRIHNNEKPVACPKCAFRCRQKASLLWHLKAHHKD